MTGLLLATLLHLAPGIRLADNFEHRRVAFREQRPTPPWYSEADEMPQHVVEELNAQQLRGVLLILEERRPRYSVPALLFSLGIVVGVPAAFLAFAVFGTVTASGNIFAALAIYFLGAVAIAGGVVALVGVALFVVQWFRRSTYMKVEDRVRARLLQIESQPLPARPLPESQPPPIQVNFVVPGPMRTVMTF